jgi:hypothetical protein
LNAATPSVDVPTATFLDFKGVAVATSSFLREAVIGFRDYARLSLVNVYPVAANLEPADLEELEFFLRSRNDVIWACDLDETERVNGARLLGDLDPAQRMTFDAVRELGAVTAPELAARFPDQWVFRFSIWRRMFAIHRELIVAAPDSGQHQLRSFSIDERLRKILLR